MHPVVKPTILAIRAIGAEFARRMFYPVAAVAGVIVGILLALSIWLTAQNAWWGLLLFVVVGVLCVTLSVFTVIYLTLRTVTPTQTKRQKQAVHSFVSQLQGLADVAGTPKWILLFRIVKDVAAPRKDGYIGTITSTTKSLKGDYTALVRLFDERYIEG